MINTKVLTCVLMLYACALKAEIIASGDGCGDNCHWSISDNGTLTISGEGETYNYGPDGSLTKENAAVYREQRPWQAYNAQIKNIVVEDGITSIGTRLFQYMDQVETINIADSVSSLGFFVMGHMDELKEVKMPQSFSLRSSVGIQVFNYTPKLENVYCYEESISLCNSIITASVSSHATQAALYVKNSDGSISYYQNKNGVWALTKKKNARIYTVEEATKLSKPTGNTIKLRYK